MSILSVELRLARRQLVQISEYEVLEDFQWNHALQKWVLHFKLICEIPSSEFVPAETNWYAVIGSSYPLGEIKIYPAQHGGITHTFHHQNYNKPADKYPWRHGDICINTPLIKWGREVFKDEPQEPSLQLKWHIERAVAWIKAAASGELTMEGEPFELPPMPDTSDHQLVFNEDQDSFNRWTAGSIHSGVFTFKQVKSNKRVYAITGFQAGKETIDYVWGSYIKDFDGAVYNGIFLLLQAIPVNYPWEIPSRWGDLFKAALRQGVDIENILHELFVKNRKEHIQYLTLGFPISDIIGGQSNRMYWLAIKLSPVQQLKGFRDEAAMYGQNARIIFAKNKAIDWLDTENWNKEQITARGTLDSQLRNKRIALIGAGAIGSLFAEMIVRLGCEALTVIDGDIAGVGNFSRHNLTMQAVRKPKAESLADRLNAIFPFVTVKFKNKSLQAVLRNNSVFLEQYDLIIDATGNDEVIQQVSNHAGYGKAFISLSIGIKARRLFCYLAKGVECGYIGADFRDRISSWLVKEKQENEGLQLSREGIGCWHPVFPARLDDIHILLGAAVQVIDSTFNENSASCLTVIEKKQDEHGIITGIEVIKE